MADYVDDFVRESRDQIQEFNEALLALEDDPDDGDAVDAAFRIAHTLKGNVRAMGFDGAGDLAHALEDLLDAIRDGDVEITGDVMDDAFGGVDALEAMIEEVADDGEPSTDPSGTVAALRATVEGDESDVAGDVPDRDDALVTVRRALEDGPRDNVHRIAVELDDPEMPGVDAMLVLRDARDRFDRLVTVPDEESLESGSFEDRFWLYVDTADSADAVASHVDAIPQVAETEVTDVTDDLPESDDGGEEELGGGVGEVESLRVDVDRVDELYNQVEKLVTNRIKLQRVVEEHGVDDAEDLLYELEKIAGNFQDTVLEIRLIPLREVVGNFPRIVRDVARAEGKEIDFAMDGTDIEIDRRILNEIGDPLVHLIRNAVAHGIEPMDEREQSGKPIEGQVRLVAERDRDTVTIEVTDDGRGLDPDELRDEAVEEGVLAREEADELDDDEAMELIFRPGFSTEDAVSDVSGRGVGMDAVKTAVDRVDGELAVDSAPGEGTTVAMTLPISVAIETVLFLEVGEETYGLPVKTVDEIASLRDVDVDTVEGQEAVTHDESVYPIVDLRDELEVPGEATDGDGMVVRLRDDERQIAIRCDGVGGQEEVVVKPFEGILSGIPGASGASVLGEGDMIVILDVSTL